MKFSRLILCAALLASLSSASAFWHGSASTPVGQTVVNVNGSALSFLNLAHTLTSGATSTAGWPGVLTSDGYPTSSLTGTAFSSNSLALFPTYYGRYKIWWTGTGAFQISPQSIVYSGGTSTQLNANGSVNQNLVFGAAGATTQPTSGAPVEIAIGALAKTVLNSLTTPGLVELVSSNSGAFGNISTGSSVQVNNVTNLSAGPYTVTKIDGNTLDLQGTTFNGTEAINSGVPGVQSEVIVATSSATWTFPIQGGTVNYSGFGGMVICRSQNVGTGGLSDCANVGSHYVNPDYVTAFKAPNLNPRWIRFMDQTAVQGNFATQFNQRPTTTQLSWGSSGSYYAGSWAGVITNGGGDAYTTASDPTNSPATGAPVDGELVTGYISTTNAGQVPTLAVTRTGFGSAKPILSSVGSGLSLTMSGSVPATGTVISFVFTGGGIASGSNPFTYTYTTSTSVLGPGNALDTSFANIAANIRADINGNVKGHAGALVTAKIISENTEITGANMTFGYNPNIDGSGVAAIGNGLTITGSDSGSSGVYTFGYVPAGFLVNNHNFLFTYSMIAGGWIAVDAGNSGSALFMNGPNRGPPLEFYEDFCNLANVGMWYNVPILYSDAAVTSMVTHIANSGVKELVLEVSNETWNSGAGGQWHILNSLGQNYGFSSAFNGGPAVDALTGIRTIQIATAARTAWSNAGRSQSQLFISDPYQLVSASAAVTNRFNGGVLTPGSNVTLAAYGASPSNGTTSLTGWSTNSSTFPNRPADWSQFVSSATYWNGTQFNSSSGGGLSGSTLSQYNCSLVASYNYVNGNAGEQSAALDFMYNGTSGDFYTTTALSGSAFTSANGGFALGAWAHGSGISGVADYWGITTIVAAYDAARTGTDPHTGLAWQLLGVAEYEGDAQAGPISGGDITTINSSLVGFGDTGGYTSGLGASCGMTPHSGGPSSTTGTAAGADANNMAVLLAAFKADNRYKLMYQRYFSDFKTAVQSQGVRLALPSTYGFESGKATWAKYPSNGIYSTPFTSWNAVQSNDN